MTQVLQVLLLLIEIGIVLILSALILIPALMLLGWLRNPVVGGLGHAFRLVIIGLSSIVSALAEGRGVLRKVSEGALDGLDYRSRHADAEHEPSGYRGWNVIGPLVYLAAVIVIALGDFDLMTLRLEALFGLGSVSPLPLSMLGMFLGMLWLATVAVYASVVFDLHGLSPITRPFHNASPRFGRVLPFLVWGGILLSLFSGGVLWYVGAQNAAGQATPLAVIFLVLFAVLMNGALILASWSIHPALIALFFLAVSALRIVAWLVERALVLVMRLLDALARVIVALFDIPARLGRKLHNYFCNFDRMQKLHWRPWPEFAELPSLLPENLAEESALLALGSDDVVGLPRITVSEDGTARRLGAGNLALPAARRSTIVVSVGALGAQMMTSLWPALKAGAAQGGILAVGEYNDETTQRSNAFVVPGVTDISPTADDLATARRLELSDESIRQRILTGMVQRMIALLIGVAASGGQVIILAGAADVDASLAQALAELHRRRQEQEIILVVCRQAPTEDPDVVAQGDALLRSLHAERTIQAMLTVEGVHAEEIRSAAVAVASLISARTLTVDNPAFAEVLARIAPETGRLGILCAREVVASAPDIPSRALARSRPQADLQDSLIQTRHAAGTALSVLAAHAPALAGEHLALVLTAPLRPGTIPWERFRLDMEAWLASQRPQAARDLLVLMPGRTLETHVAILYPQTTQHTITDEGESDETASELAGQFGTSPKIDADPVAPGAVYRSNGTH